MRKGQKTNYKWVDVERERTTTNNPSYWIEGFLYIVAIATIPCILYRLINI